MWQCIQVSLMKRELPPRLEGLLRSSRLDRRVLRSLPPSSSSSLRVDFLLFLSLSSLSLSSFFFEELVDDFLALDDDLSFLDESPESFFLPSFLSAFSPSVVAVFSASTTLQSASSAFSAPSSPSVCSLSLSAWDLLSPFSSSSPSSSSSFLPTFCVLSSSSSSSSALDFSDDFERLDLLRFFVSTLSLFSSLSALSSSWSASSSSSSSSSLCLRFDFFSPSSSSSSLEESFFLPLLEVLRGLFEEFLSRRRRLRELYEVLWGFVWWCFNRR